MAASNIDKLIEEVGLSKFSTELKDAGVDDLDMLKELTLEDMEEMGIPKLRCRNALKKISALEASAGGGASTAGEVVMPTDFTAAAKANPNWSRFTLKQKQQVINGYENAYACAMKIRELSGNDKFLCTFDPSNALLEPPYEGELMQHWKDQAGPNVTTSELKSRQCRGEIYGNKNDPLGTTQSFLEHFGNDPKRTPVERNFEFSHLLRAVEKACDTPLSKDSFNDTFSRLHWTFDHPDNGARNSDRRSYHINKTLVLIINDHSPGSGQGRFVIDQVIRDLVQRGDPSSSRAKHYHPGGCLMADKDGDAFKPIDGFPYTM
eukprot:CAMPEP_0119127048 /NCGR_PEP_ID=MMETSP1310-20130426/5740_1 /TAXON_ID=464262 /ORGANISM="Genus nov. species nov., Strain RCC2339" /LENGTH=319 /DNA_ID=CAMNT_0007117267 /DNA_START=62 /DNA_END=1021 /DNA_ORIENTATION=-